MSTPKWSAEFLSEAQELVDAYNAALSALDEGCKAGGDLDPERINECFRIVHSLKGLTSLLGVPNFADLSHRLETLLDALRLGKLRLHTRSLDTLFESLELFQRGVAAAASERDLDKTDTAGFFKRLDGLIRADLEGEANDKDDLEQFELDPAMLSVLTEYEEHRLRENVRRGSALYRLHGDFSLAEIEQSIEEMKARVKPAGEIVTYLPSGDASDPEALALDILIASRWTLSELTSALSGLVQTEVHAIPRAVRAPKTAPVRTLHTQTEATGESRIGQDDEPLGSLRSVTQSVRVDIRKLDTLMNAVGELGLVQGGLVGLLERLSEAGHTDESRVLRQQVRALERKLRELQQGILEVRMVPLRQIFDKLTRVVRKISRKLEKQIRLEILGGDTELDKLIVEELSDPLMHIIRNAIDHGIESPAERRAAGKPEVGTVTVQAIQQGNRVIVSVSDDGRGIDETRVAAAALKRGLVDANIVRELSRTELFNLLFLPGMSTREEATEWSGRGVGLDVVKTNISNLSGIIDITSQLGVGTNMAITLPVTLAMIQAILVKVAGRTYAVPLNSVVESLTVTPEEIHTIEGREIISLRRQSLRLARMAEVFALQPETQGANALPPAQYYVIVVGIAQHRLGLVVDEFVTQQDIVIKSLGRTLAGVRGVAGATELGGQVPVLVLDIPAIVEDAVARTPSREVARA